MIGEILWPVAFLLGVFRFSKALEAFAPSKPEVGENANNVAVPEDLVAFALQEREAWAQDEVLRAVRERYDELKDWNAVRAALGIGRID